MRSYYILNNARIKREANTLYVENAADGTRRPVPIEDVESLYLYGEVDLNTKLLNFLSQKRITLHVFNYYGFYAGSYYPREYLNSGCLLVQQVAHYTDPAKRLALAQEIVRGSAHSLRRTVAYYSRRRVGDDREPPGEIAPAETPPDAHPTDEAAEAAVDAFRDDPADIADAARDDPAADAPDANPAADALVADPFETQIPFDDDSPLDVLLATMDSLAEMIGSQPGVGALMGIEGKMRERYYQAWRHILGGEWAFERRVRRPPDNEVNALISFGNSHLYTVCLGELYRTQLTPTISYLHEPGARRFSLALDLSEIFKPLIVDRAIFRLLNTGQLKDAHFERSLKACYLNDSGRKLLVSSLEERLATTIKHRRLGRSVSYRHLIRLECYKLIKHLTGDEPYRAFRAWW
jgi:CRISPR/Cas system-associated endonuclease Cas1